MYSVSDEFKNAVRNGGATWIARGEIRERDTVINGHSEMPIISGGVSIDKFASVRRRTSVTLAIGEDDMDWVPAVSTDLLFPTGRELQLYAGFEFQDGTQELVPMGLFRIAKPQVNEQPTSLTVQVDGYDRSRQVSRARFTTPYTIANGTNVGDAIRTIIMRAFPWFADEHFLFVPTDTLTPQLIFDTSDDPWVKCLELAESIGFELYFDVLGRAVHQPEPNPSTADVVWSYDEGDLDTVLEVNKDLDDELAYNGCIVVGQNTSQNTYPVRAEAWDTDPDSPTYYDPLNPSASLYGPNPFFIESQFITTTAQAQAAADGNLLSRLGILEEIGFTAVPNPAHEAGDIFHMARTNPKIDVISVLDAMSMDLGLGAVLGATARKRRVTT